jgi:hypothetical protein
MWISSWAIPGTRSAAPKEIVMANVIEFYIPKNFQSRRKSTNHLQGGRVIEFRLPAKKSA